MRAIKDVFDPFISLGPAARTATGTGSVMDFANGLENLIQVEAGTVTDGTHTPKIQAGNASDASDMADVAAADQVGAFTALASNTVQSVSYIGAKRYVRVVITTSGATTGAVTRATGLVRLRKQP